MQKRLNHLYRERILSQVRKKTQSATRMKQPQPTVGLGDLVWVQCKSQRCLAYQTAQGKWISFYTKKQLTDFMKVIG